GAGYCAEPGIGERGRGIAEGRMVEHVEELGTDFEGSRFLELDAAAQAEIDIELVRAHNAVASGVAELACQILLERGGVEIFGERRIVDVRVSDDVGTVEVDAGQRIVPAGGETEEVARTPAGYHKHLPSAEQAPGGGVPVITRRLHDEREIEELTVVE